MKSHEKGPMGGAHYFVLRQGGGDICNITAKKRPCLHYHNLKQDIAHQHTRPVAIQAI